MKVMSPELEAGLEIIEEWMGLHRNVEIHYLVTTYELTFRSYDGDRLNFAFAGKTVAEAIEVAGVNREIIRKAIP